MPRRNASFQIDIAEQRSARLVRPAHHHPRRYRAKGESCSANHVEAGLFQQPAKGAFQVLTGSFGFNLKVGLKGSYGPFAIMIILSTEIVYINATSTRECAFRAMFAAECW